MLRDLTKFRWKGAGFEAWLFRIAYNLVIDNVRLESRESPIDLDREEPAPVELGPEPRALSVETAATLRSYLDRLPADQSEVLLLRFAADLDTKEIGQVMNRNSNAVRQLQFRALASLRKMMVEGVGSR